MEEIPAKDVISEAYTLYFKQVEEARVQRRHPLVRIGQLAVVQVLYDL